jgi:hypothetical protein
MKFNTLSKIGRLAYDVYHGTTGQFSAEEAHEKLREALNKLAGEDFSVMSRRAKHRNLETVFEIIEEVLPVVLTEGIKSQFDDLVDVRNLAFGDKNVFMIDDYHLFNVATIAAGTNNIRRQRLDRTPFQVNTEWKGIKFYEELELFLAGRVDWAKTINKIARSFQAQVKADIYAAIVAGYTALSSPYKYSGAYDRTELNTLVQHIEAITNQNAIVFGTKLALQRATPAYVSYGLMDQRNNDGFFRIIDGITMVEIPQSISAGTDNFAIANDFLLVVPTMEEKIVKLVLEGQPIIEEDNGGGRYKADNTIDYLYKEKYGVGIVTSSKFGAYLLA